MASQLGGLVLRRSVNPAPLVVVCALPGVFLVATSFSLSADRLSFVVAGPGSARSSYSCWLQEISVYIRAWGIFWSKGCRPWGKGTVNTVCSLRLR